jgi:phosphoribosylformylglycinamidine cyclo-ligase
MERVFNMGVGMTAVVAAADADRALQLLASRNMPSWPLGEVAQGDGVKLAGSHPA